MLSPYICFISFSYLDLFVLGDNSWIRDLACITKHPYVLIHIRTKGELGTVKLV